MDQSAGHASPNLYERVDKPDLVERNTKPKGLFFYFKIGLEAISQKSEQSIV